MPKRNVTTGLMKDNPYQTGYQGTSEQYLGEAGDAYRKMLNPSQNQLLQTGQTLYGQAKGMFDPAFQRIQTLSAGQQQPAADRAAVDTGLMFEKAKAMKERELARMGINPNSGRFAGLISRENLARAAAEAGNMARARGLAAERETQAAGQLANLSAGQMAAPVNMLSAGLQNENMNLNQGATGLERMAGNYGSLAGGQAAQQAGQASQTAQRGFDTGFQSQLDMMLGQRGSTETQTKNWDRMREEGLAKSRSMSQVAGLGLLRNRR
jgi:hypothetical protein